MEDLRHIAATYFLASSEEDQQRVVRFIRAMDKDGNGKVDYLEFMQFLKQQGFNNYADTDFFKKLDINGDNRLDVMEAMTLYYIILSGRPFCTGCENFITAEYFVCVECFEKSSTPVYLCLGCYKTRNYRHWHDITKNPLFLDTYAMLESRRLSALTKKGHEPSSSSQAIVSSSIRTSEIRLTAVAFKTFETALSLANLKVGLLSLVISACTIM